MWISRKKWKVLEKRVADLEKEVQSQPEKIMQTMQSHLYNQMTKSYLPRHQKDESQFDEQV